MTLPWCHYSRLSAFCIFNTSRRVQCNFIFAFRVTPLNRCAFAVIGKNASINQSSFCPLLQPHYFFVLSYLLRLFSKASAHSFSVPVSYLFIFSESRCTLELRFWVIQHVPNYSDISSALYRITSMQKWLITSCCLTKHQSNDYSNAYCYLDVVYTQVFFIQQQRKLNSCNCSPESMLYPPAK